MRAVRLAPHFKIWLIFGATAGLIAVALLALFLVWRSAPIPQTDIAIVPWTQPLVGGVHLKQTPRLFSATAGAGTALNLGEATGPSNNLAALVFGSGAVLGMVGATLRLANLRRSPAVLEASARRRNQRRVISPSPSL